MFPIYAALSLRALLSFSAHADAGGGTDSVEDLEIKFAGSQGYSTVSLVNDGSQFYSLEIEDLSGQKRTITSKKLVPSPKHSDWDENHGAYSSVGMGRKGSFVVRFGEGNLALDLWKEREDFEYSFVKKGDRVALTEVDVVKDENGHADPGFRLEVRANFLQHSISVDSASHIENRYSDFHGESGRLPENCGAFLSELSYGEEVFQGELDKQLPRCAAVVACGMLKEQVKYGMDPDAIPDYCRK